MRYLIEKGHRRIGVIGGRSGNIHTQKRLVGVQRALYEANIPYNPAWVRYGDWFMSSGEVQADPLVMSGVTAIFCMSDRMADGIYRYLDKRGMRAGVDLSVMGFDNQDLAEHLCPPLTTMKLPLAEIGDNAARLLMDFLNERQSFPPKKHIELSIPCSLIRAMLGESAVKRFFFFPYFLSPAIFWPEFFCAFCQEKSPFVHESYRRSLPLSFRKKHESREKKAYVNRLTISNLLNYQ